MPPDRRAFPATLLVLLAGCASRSAPSVPPAVPPPAKSVDPRAEPTRSLPPVPEVRGRLAVRVVYPRANAVVAARDSTFLFGSTGTGEARLVINGEPVPVWPNGAWLAWVPLPPDSAMRFRIDAWTAAESVSTEHVVRRRDWRPPPPSGLWIDTTSLSPRGAVWWPPEEYLTLRVRASAGADLRLRLADGTTVPLSPVEETDGAVGSPAGLAPADLAGAPGRYVGLLRGRTIGPHPGPVLPPPAAPPVPLAGIPAPPLRCAAVGGCRGGPVDLAGPVAEPDSSWAILEAIRGPDTVRSRWPLQVALLDTLPLVAELDDDPAASGTTDSLTVGRALPGGTYHWFFPTGTRARVSGRAGDDLRLRLAAGTETWVAQGDARPAALTSTAPAVVGSVTLTPAADRVTLRVPLGWRVPVQVLEEERELTLRLYGAAGDIEWIRYGAADSLVRRVRWAQESAEQVSLTVELARSVWGYRLRWERSDLVFEIRRPPPLDEGHPLRGRLIAVDPGHPPAGATGPTGLREAEANLAVALELRHLLEEAGARVLMTRTADIPLDLWPRVRLAESAGAEVLVSVHNNALPDGINPFVHHGSSVFYNQPRSVPLARAVQDELVSHLGLPDLGIGRGDLALVRVTWMPSVLTEGLFMMLPDQEAALRTVEGRRRYATAIFQGLRRFLRQRAQER